MNNTTVLDLTHHMPCSDSAASMLQDLFADSKVSDILEALGGAETLEIRFPTGPCGESYRNLLRES